MIEKLINVLSIKELRQKFIFTLIIFAVYRLGTHIPVPGVDSAALMHYFNASGGALFNIYNLFSGGALGRLSIFALGVMPYISASIIMQLMTAVIPSLERLQKEEGDYGRWKISQYTRYLTIAIAAAQSFGLSIWISNLKTETGQSLITDSTFLFIITTTITITTGTVLLMWLGEKITEFGIGNGISMIILAGIVATIPTALIRSYELLKVGEISILTAIAAAIIVVVVVAGIVYIQEAERRIPIQYARRNAPSSMASYLPFKLNPSGVIPIIFAVALLIFPVTIAQLFADKVAFARLILDYLSPQSYVYFVLYVGLIIFFAYFYTAILINPQDIADNLRRNGAFIPGVRAGSQTAEYINYVLTRLVFAGSIFLSILAVLPMILIKWLNVPFYFGGTSALIVVVVALDTLHQIEAYLSMKKYETFLKRG
ncbi:preprotein translocase subunit SecY [Venenivibrio stagnispumantis]|uniref:Protein translocase subunit SecY n=1 Tax=Venenivibrio stagnispumantis TaxID=407998 RepID=A0AA45WLK2_9AQUI|nr:preprotein translocase subunit SecY [Venenivibrio stagnispumantis]MCW4573297.1 preprotein translocase subunit SecY [Venenivibrio stagnispumantis]SMP11183.1 protein translocase subunit secY/sec61 alpha [Venenivibrio stagnispumantis]